MKKLLFATAMAAMLVALGVPSAAAGHGGEPVTSHRTYEWGQTEVIAINCATGSSTLGTGCDPTGQTQDGSIDIAGIIWTPDELPDGVDSVQTAIVDDVFGSGVISGDACTDENGNNVCGETEEGEVETEFCGSSATFDIPPAPNWDAFVVFLEGVLEQNLNGCTPDAYATTGGVLNPNGGVFTTFG